MLHSNQEIANYKNAAQANQPRELRIMERIDGINQSVDQLAAFLEAFTGRVTGSLQGDNTDRPPSAGILDSIGRIEEGLRRAHALVRDLDNAF